MTRELLTTAEVAVELGVSPRRVSQLLERRRDFPRPYAVTRGVRRERGLKLWRPEDIEAWAASADRSVGRPALDGVRLSPAQERMLADVRKDGAGSYDGRARRTAEALAAAGLVTFEAGPSSVLVRPVES